MAKPSPVPPAGSVPGDEARRGPPPERHGHGRLEAWFDGACEPVNPGGIGTWGFVVREDGLTLAEMSGPCEATPGAPMTNNVAEYEALLRLLRWLGAERPHRDATIHGDSSLVIRQVEGAWKANAEHLRHLRDECRKAMEPLGEVTFVHVGRELNADADRLTHDAYVRALEADAALAQRYRGEMATPDQVEACRRLGIPVYAFLGRREAARLLDRAKSAGAGGPTGTPGGASG